jgi:hypothetical protein
LIAQFRQQFSANQSFAVLDLSKWFSPEVAARILIDSPKVAATQISSNAWLWIEDSKPREKEPDPAIQHWLNNANRFIRNLILVATGLDELHVDRGAMNLRVNSGIDQNEGIAFPKWHLDGGVFNATISLKGPGTELAREIPNSREEVEASQIVSVPAGHIVIFLGKVADRFKSNWRPTWHRTPSNALSQERILLLLRY